MSLGSYAAGSIVPAICTSKLVGVAGHTAAYGHFLVSNTAESCSSNVLGGPESLCVVALAVQLFMRTQAETLLVDLHCLVPLRADST